MQLLKSFLLAAILILLLLSPAQSLFPIVKEKPLHGYEETKPVFSLKYFTWHRWFGGAFQEAMGNRFNTYPGFRNSLVRIYSQVDYSLFGLTHAKGFIRGKGGNLFEEDYIHESYGTFFIGEETLNKKMVRLKSVYDSLKARNVSLVLVFEPGKATCYPQHIPGRYGEKRPGHTNYSYMTMRAKELGLPFLDLNSYFLAARDTSRYPLFPKYGMHWSLYGAAHAVDTLAGFIGAQRNIRLPRFDITTVELAGRTRGADNDIVDILNLVFPLPAAQGAYPTVTFRKDTGTVKPFTLVISDSFYEYVFYPYGEKMFRGQQFWYYNSRLFPSQNTGSPVFVDKTNLLRQLTTREVILLMVSEINLHCAFWNFADEAWLAFHPGVQDSRIYNIENGIRNDRNWFRGMVKGAARAGLPLGNFIHANAEYVFRTGFEGFENKNADDSIHKIMFDIMDNPDWFALVRRKAEAQGVPLDSMLYKDAAYTYTESKQKH